MVIDNKKGNSKQYFGLRFFVSSLQSGLFGFAIFFTVLLISKFLSSLIGRTDVFRVDLSDVSLSFIGFILTFLISLLKHFSPNEQNKNRDSHKLNKKTP